MKKVIIAVIAIIVVLVGAFATRNGSSSSDNSVFDEISANNGQLIDVRTVDEYADSHADGAINIPLANILDGDYSGIDDSRPIYLYCKSGNRAGQAKTALEGFGYENVTNLGGLSDLIDDGGVVCSSTEPACS